MRTTSLLTTFLLTTAALAAPTRTQSPTHCRCLLVSDALHPLETPSAAHWTPANWKPTDPTPSASPYHQTPDQCENLGPELENFRHAKPDLYESYVRDKISTTSYPTTHSDTEMPLSTQVLMNRVSRPTSHANERIVCYAEPETFSAYNDSCLTLWALQIIVAATILACVAEAIHLGMRWFFGTASSSPDCEESHMSSQKALRLPGAERLLLAIPTRASEKDDIFSPGADKKTKAYEATRYFVVKSSSGRREFIAYDSEDDDEANRPVM
ncbi:uncharacterized protein EKO05_0004412 [Ascochyta rabiei]|uniref:Uncharacterized protein n=1 Tax=Didymella rabiei TaxID=5454 RepID=A0A162Y4S0_DIDRA|nr:uncharacterized protein EKO05_0004412 [Ascochyta rabiei]KZM19818.1 hypothetical protein ST47_g8934 [Ascochyta rabiei]UPX13917.1 hypothetical protein EKO05_0004412 [Ascochyta rabiei]